MIEDGLRTIVADAIDEVPAYARLLPLPMPECICIQENGGDPVDAGIRRTRHRVTVMAVSTDRARAIRLLREARNALITNMPRDIDGIHYYTATALADGSLKAKRQNGPRYVEYTDMEVLASL